MTNNNKVHQYKTCVSTGPQHLNPDLTVGETAQRAHPHLMPAKALIVWAFGLGFIEKVDLDKIS
jgi:hypothetical protein